MHMLVCECVFLCVSNQITSLEICYHHPASPVKQYHWSVLDQTNVCADMSIFCVYVCVRV